MEEQEQKTVEEQKEEENQGAGQDKVPDNSTQEGENTSDKGEE